MFWMKVHHTDEGRLLAACDESVLGETYTEDDMTLEVAEDFYKGDKVDFLTVLDELTEAATANFVGHDLIDQLLDNDIIQDDEVEEVGEMVHVHLYFI